MNPKGFADKFCESYGMVFSLEDAKSMHILDNCRAHRLYKEITVFQVDKIQDEV